MEELFSLSSVISLITLTLLEVVLGIDNVIFVSIIMGRMPQNQQARARRFWMFSGMAVRIVLLLCLGWLVQQKGKPLFELFGKGFDLASLVMLAGGLFLLVKTVGEIHHKLEGDEEAREEGVGSKMSTFGKAIGQIILVDMVFSFDSMITAVGIAKHVEIMIVAVVIAMVIMFLFSKSIADFIHKHPTLKMLALSFLVLVGVVLIMEGWNSDMVHHYSLKNYVYFAMVFSFGVELLNMRMSKRTKGAVQLREPVSKKQPD